MLSFCCLPLPSCSSSSSPLQAGGSSAVSLADNSGFTAADVAGAQPSSDPPSISVPSCSLPLFCSACCPVPLALSSVLVCLLLPLCTAATVLLVPVTAPYPVIPLPDFQAIPPPSPSPPLNLTMHRALAWSGRHGHSELQRAIRQASWRIS